MIVTIIHPTAWSEQVEKDLGLSEKQAEKVRTSITSFDSPVEVCIDGNKVSYKPVEVDNEAHAAREAEIEAIRVYNSTEEQLKRKVVTLKEVAERNEAFAALEKNPDDKEAEATLRRISKSIQEREGK